MSHFFDLPPEIRVNIYSYVVVETHPLQILTHPYRRGGKSIDVPEPDLLATCKLIRKEALPVFYGANIFEPLSCTNSWVTARFVASLSDDKVRMLRAVRAQQDPKYFSGWSGHTLPVAQIHGDLIMAGRRGILRRDALLFPFRQFKDGTIAWCTYDELDDFELCEVDGVVLYWRRKTDEHAQSA